jgi:hypothetical protein
VEDLARIVAFMFAGWMVAMAAFLLFAWRAPVSWNRTLRIIVLLVTGGITVFLTGALFGVKLAAATGLAAVLVFYWGATRR